MPKVENIEILIKSLTKAEKRHFKMQTQWHEGEKDYLKLFDLIDKHAISFDQLKKTFNNRYPKGNFEIAIKHLYKVLIKSISGIDKEEDIELQFMDYLKEIKILFQKEIHVEGFKVLERAKKLAYEKENHYWYLLFGRTEIEYHIKTNFLYCSENKLTNLQQKLIQSIQHIRTINDHSALYEILSIRYAKQGLIKDLKEKEKLSDLLLSELNINSRSSYKLFEAQKLHLLFQSIYCRMTSDHKTGLRTCFELSELFEKNKKLWFDSPGLYIQHLKQMFHHLRYMKKYDEIGYFINHLKFICEKSEESNKQALTVLYQFEMYGKLDNGLIRDAELIQLNYSPKIKAIYHRLTPVEKAEIAIIESTLYLKMNRINEASKCISVIISNSKIFSFLTVYRIIRLIRILIRIELEDIDYLEHDIRSFEREIIKKQQIMQTETIILTFAKEYIKNYPSTFKKINEKYINQLTNIQNNPYEIEMLQYFNFIQWFEKKRL